jgi:uncharacterized circularly permuted ATP-grasp superfamily protein/uncharacterized alpha-E superfamily protein
MNQTLVEDDSGTTGEKFSSLLNRYAPMKSVFDEAVDGKGQVRAATKRMFGSLGEIPLDTLSRRISQSQRQLQLDGAAFDPYDFHGEDSRPWILDPIPLTISKSEWKSVSTGIEQRAHLADLILLDLLGPQTLLRERVLPPDVLFAHPKYSPVCHHLVPRPRKHVHLFAADLARSTDGSWWVTSDRTRTPFGLGYILENRLTTSRMFPEAFGACNVQRLAPFFMAWQRTLSDLASHFKDNPRIAIWTKGPGSRSYFEDSFLARYLGFTLVEGEDLAVRDGRVMLKTLGGLLPVEVLQRRVEDYECDPTEMMSDRSYGISGLLDVVRQGSVAVSNSIGSFLAESPILMAYLPVVCKHLLGEELKLPSVATWWCGQDKARTYVLKHFDRLLIRKAFRHGDAAPYNPARMTPQQKEKLLAAIQRYPRQYVGQEKVTRSTAPVFEEESVEPWSLALRAFSVADGEGYTTLPGALARVSQDADVLTHNMTSGEKSQDVWIVSEEPAPAVSLLPSSGSSVELKRGGAELPSRVADNLFWFSRNLERAEQAARLIRYTLQELMGEDVSEGIVGLTNACKKTGQLRGSIEDRSGLEIAKQLTRDCLDETRPHTLRRLLILSHEIAQKVRDRLSSDSFRVISELRDLYRSPVLASYITPNELLSLLDDTVGMLNAMSGFTSEGMTRTQVWGFTNLGRRIERAYQTAQLLEEILNSAKSENQVPQSLEDCLQVFDSFMTYRSRYLATIHPAAVLDLLIADPTNPRSLLFQLQDIRERVDALPRPANMPGLSAEQRLAFAMYSKMSLCDVTELASQANEGDWKKLKELLQGLRSDLPKLSDSLSSRFLIHAGLQRHFSQSLGEVPPEADELRSVTQEDGSDV